MKEDSMILNTWYLLPRVDPERADLRGLGGSSLRQAAPLGGCNLVGWDTNTSRTGKAMFVLGNMHFLLLCTTAL